MTIFVFNEDISDSIRVDHVSVTIHTARYSVCGNNVLDAGEQCDDVNTGDGDSCSATCSFESAATVCRASAGTCDVAEACTGSDPACPPDSGAIDRLTSVLRGRSGAGVGVPLPTSRSITSKHSRRCLIS